MKSQKLRSVLAYVMSPQNKHSDLNILNTKSIKFLNQIRAKQTILLWQIARAPLHNLDNEKRWYHFLVQGPMKNWKVTWMCYTNKSEISLRPAQKSILRQTTDEKSTNLYNLRWRPYPCIFLWTFTPYDNWHCTEHSQWYLFTLSKGNHTKVKSFFLKNYHFSQNITCYELHARQNFLYNKLPAEKF